MPLPDRHRLVVTPRLLSLLTTIAIVSVAQLVLAFAVSEHLRVVLSGAGLAGLIVLRRAAMYGGWLPRCPAAPRWTAGAHLDAAGPKPRANRYAERDYASDVCHGAAPKERGRSIRRRERRRWERDRVERSDLYRPGGRVTLSTAGPFPSSRSCA